MNTELYETLGVDRKATTAEIKRAYRKKASKTHPDVEGGSRAAFDKVSLAMRVLTDSRARDKYDRTGDAESPEPDTTLSNAMQVAFQTLDQAVAQIAKTGRKIETIDPLPIAISILQDQLRALAKNKKEAQNGVKVATKFAKRFRAKKGKVNRMGMMLESRARDLEHNIGMIERDEAVAKLAIEVLRDHEFDVEREEDMWGMTQTTVSLGFFR